jgi:hypothetical protein
MLRWVMLSTPTSGLFGAHVEEWRAVTIQVFGPAILVHVGA